MSSRPRLTSEQIKLLLEAIDTQAKALVEKYREVRRNPDNYKQSSKLVEKLRALEDIEIQFKRLVGIIRPREENVYFNHHRVIH